MSQRGSAARAIRELTNCGIEPVVINGEVHTWTGTVWARMDAQELYKAVLQYTRERTHLSINGTCDIITNQLQRIIDVPQGIACLDGFISIDNEGTIHVDAHKPTQYQTFVLNAHYDPHNIAAQAPKWHRTVEQLLTPQYIPVLQEFFGATLLGLATKFGKAAVFLGDGHNGKTMIIDVATKFFLPWAVKRIAPHDWHNYMAAELANARLNAIAELPSREIMASERFKVIVEGQEFCANRKYKHPFPIKPIAAHWFAVNRLPPTADVSHGFWRRMLVIPFDKRIPETAAEEATTGIVRNPNLAQELATEELSGIFNWAIEGAIRLTKQHEYTEPKANEDEETPFTEWQLATNHVMAFVKEACEPLSKPTTSGMALFTAFRWYTEKRCMKTLSATKFFYELRALGYMPTRRSAARMYPLVVQAAYRPGNMLDD